MYLKDEKVERAAKVEGLPIARILPLVEENQPSVFLAEHVGWSGRESRVWVVADDQKSVEDGLRGFLRIIPNDGSHDSKVLSAGPGNPDLIRRVAAAIEEVHASSETSSGIAIEIAESLLGNAYVGDGRLSDAEIWVRHYGNPADSIDAAVALAVEVGVETRRLLAEAADHNEMRHVTRHIARRFTVRLLRGLAAGR